MEGAIENWVNVGEAWQMRGTDGEGKEQSIRFVVLETGIYHEKGNIAKSYPGAKVQYKDGSVEVLCLSQFEYFERLDN